MTVKTFDYKLPGMRKPQNWIVYPRANVTDPVKVQSDKSIGIFDPVTNKGLLCTTGSNSPALFLHGKPFAFPHDFVHLALANEPKSGDEIGGKGSSVTIA